jgi:hypothetical protein
MLILVRLNSCVLFLADYEVRVYVGLSGRIVHDGDRDGP